MDQCSNANSELQERLSAQDLQIQALGDALSTQKDEHHHSVQTF